MRRLGLSSWEGPGGGRAQDLLLLACGRRLPPGRLEGVAADRFSGTG